MNGSTQLSPPVADPSASAAVSGIVSLIASVRRGAAREPIDRRNAAFRCVARWGALVHNPARDFHVDGGFARLNWFGSLSLEGWRFLRRPGMADATFWATRCERRTRRAAIRPLAR